MELTNAIQSRHAVRNYTDRQIDAETKPGRTLCVLFHGDCDVDVPTEQSIEYSRRQEALGENVQLHVIPDTNHFDFIDPMKIII